MAHDHDHQHDHDHNYEHEHEDAEALQAAQAEARRRHALAQIRQYPDVALRLAAKELEDADFDDDLRRLAERMERLMYDAQGIGLAATQVGVLRRVMVFAPDSEEEGCLSLQGVRVPVERAVRVTLTGRDVDGNDVRYELDGIGARVAQHETDHLDGVLIIDRTDSEHRKRALGVLRPQPVLR